MLNLHFQLLGDFLLRYNNVPTGMAHLVRQQSLLAYLVLHRHSSHSRQQLAYLFWPDASEAQARANLRKMLYDLRKLLPQIDDFVHIETQFLQWRNTTATTLDVDSFTASLANAKQAQGPAEMRAALEQAVAFYTGDLLPACYDDWIAREREVLRQQFVTALEELINVLELQQEYSLALNCAQRLLHVDALRESTYQLLMRLHGLNGDRAAALRSYHMCAMTLQQELGVAPSTTTREIYEQLLHSEAAFTPITPLPIELPLMGRQDEWRTLQRLWSKSRAGNTHFLCISGEAGIGKTRLAEEMLHWCKQQGIAAIRTRAYAAEGGLAYAPIVEILADEALHNALMYLDSSWQSEIARLCPYLFELYPELRRVEAGGEQWQRQRLFESLARLFTGVKRPLLLVLDDLQWFDSGTLEWLHYLLRFDRRACLLIIGTLRPEEIDDSHPVARLLLALRAAEQLTEIALMPLDVSATSALANHIAEHTFDVATAQELYRATEGNPLFIVEMARANLNHGRTTTAGVQPITQLLPPKVQAAIQTRLAQLSAKARKLAHLAAVIGRSFSLDVLAFASGQNEESVVETLDELWQRRIIREQGLNGYDFSHDRIREVAYAQNSRARRRLLHRQVAEALESIYGVEVGTVSGQLAVHCEEAGLLEKAVDYYWQASQIAEQRFARADEVSYLRKALSLLELLPESFKRQQQRLNVYLALGTALSTVESYPKYEVHTTFTKAIALSQQLQQTISHYNAQRGLYLLLLELMAFPELHPCCDILLQLAHELQDPTLLFDAYHNLAHVWYLEGEFVCAHEALTHALEYRHLDFSEGRHPFVAADPGQLCALDQANLLCLLGYAAQGRSLMDKALAQMATSNHPFIHAVELSHAALVGITLREPQLVAMIAAEMIELTTKFDLAMFDIDAKVFGDWSVAMLTHDRVVVERLRKTVPRYESIHITMFLPLAYALLAEAEYAIGEYEYGLAAVDRALVVAQESGERYWYPEIYRLRGELLIAQGAAPTEVEACYCYAVEIARQQKAKAIELRAATSLAQFWYSQGMKAQAHQMLSALYTQFTEGFDTPDLRAAYVLLAQLR